MSCRVRAFLRSRSPTVTMQVSLANLGPHAIVVAHTTASAQTGTTPLQWLQRSRVRDVPPRLSEPDAGGSGDLKLLPTQFPRVLPRVAGSGKRRPQHADNHDAHRGDVPG